ncbi:MAG: tetratricopeptide repeat protein [Gemmatimonadaceae bacterium]
MSDTVEERWTRHSEAGRRYMSERNYPEAEKCFLAAIREARQLGSEDLRMAASLSSLGLLKYKQRDLVQAEMLLRQSLTIRERSLGAEHVGVVQSMSYLAAVYYARGELDRADDLFRRALRISERHLGEDHPDVATMISNLAQLHFKRGDFASAGQLLTRLLAVREKTLGENHPEVAAILSRLAQVRYAELDSEGAELLSRRALSIRVRMEGAAKQAAAPGSAPAPAQPAAESAPAPAPVRPAAATAQPISAEPSPAPVAEAKPAVRAPDRAIFPSLSEIAARAASPARVGGAPATIQDAPRAALPVPSQTFAESRPTRLPIAPPPPTPKVEPVIAPLASTPFPSFSDRLPGERPRSGGQSLDEHAPAGARADHANPFDTLSAELPVTAPRYRTREIELPWGRLEVWKVAAGALLVLGVGGGALLMGDDEKGESPVPVPAATAHAAPAGAATVANVPQGRSDVVLYSAPVAPTVADSAADRAPREAQPRRSVEPPRAAPRRTASSAPARPSSRPKADEEQEDIPTRALTAPSLTRAMSAIDAALDPNSLVSRLTRARSVVDSVNRVQVRTGLERPKE